MTHLVSDLALCWVSGHGVEMVTTSNLRIRGRMFKAHRTHRHLSLPIWSSTRGNRNSARPGWKGTLRVIRTGRRVQSAPRFRHTPDRAFSHHPTSSGMLVRAGTVWSPQTLPGTVGMGIGEANERSGGVGGGLFEGAGNGISGGRGEEEDHVKGHQDWTRLSFCDG